MLYNCRNIVNKYILCSIIVGVTTTSTTLYALIAILADQQNIQKKMHDEIDAKIGTRCVSV